LSDVKVKICGLTRARDVEAALTAGADVLGFVFADSKRKIGSGRARELALPISGKAMRVGLFMNQKASEIEKILERVPLDMLQFHGAEENTFCGRFGVPFLKAVSMTAGNAAAEVVKYPDAAGLLFDSHPGGGAGGTGVAFDWTRIPDCPQPVWLAGGLHAGNVVQAIQLARPWAVDVSSGVEDAPGIKSVDKLTEFVCAVKSASVQNVI
jgi:phosphoribosylanthranilate isomerase